MRKLLMSLTVLAGATMASAANARPATVDFPFGVNPASVQQVQYHQGGRYHEWRRHQEWRRWHRHAEWRHRRAYYGS